MPTISKNKTTESRMRLLRLTTETVEGAALALKSVDNVEGGDSLALCVLGIGDGITDDTLKERLENTTRLLVDHWDLVSIDAHDPMH
jgi:hypothetical protein